MTFSLHAATIPSCRQILAALAALIDKAEGWSADHGQDGDALVGARLAEDMLPFGYQVKSTIAHSVGAIEGVRRGVFSPDLGGWPQTLPALKARVEEAAATLDAIDPAEVDGFVGRPMRFEIGDRRLDFTAETFLLSFSQPNFYFHATTAYDILRWKGMPIGKRDFVGRPRTIA